MVRGSQTKAAESSEELCVCVCVCVSGFMCVRGPDFVCTWAGVGVGACFSLEESALTGPEWTDD